MDQRTKELNDKIAGLRQVYDQVERTAEEVLGRESDEAGGELAYLDKLRSISCDKEAPMGARNISCLAQFGVVRLLLNEAEREYADLLLGIDPNEPSVP